MNKHRAKWDKNVSPKCTFCELHDETVIHVFCQCTIVNKKVWTPLKKWLYHFYFINLETDESTILLQMYKDSFKALVNTIILITKQYIYSIKCTNKTLYFPELVAKISMYRRLEEYSARKAKKLHVHKDKWKMYDLI